MSSLKAAAEKEVKRMQSVFSELQKPSGGKALDFYSFAKNYSDDSKHFLSKSMHLEAFEAAIIAWAYIDAGLKMGFFSISDALRPLFTVG